MRSIYRKILQLKGQCAGAIWSVIIKICPSIHAKHEMKRQKQFLLRRVDIKNPKYFNEKMLYLKYKVYNNSSLVAQCYNKYEVRKYIEKKGLGHILNYLHGAWDSIDEISWDTLPEECVIKVSNGYAGHVFKRKDQPFDVAAAKKTLENSLKISSYRFKSSGDLFAYNTPQKIICERMLHSSKGFASPEDYKFYCFHGKPLYVEYMQNRYGEKDALYQEVFMDIDLNDAHKYEGEAKPGTIQKPECYSEMVQIARILSKDFPFVRVDLYVENERPIFGELTFTPYHVETEKSLIEFGALIDVNNTKEEYPWLMH